MRNFLKGTIAVILGVMASGCQENQADVASRNLSIDADNFKVERRIIFYNGNSDTVLLMIQGLCSIENNGVRVAVTCKVGEGKYKKHFLGLANDITYFAEQVEGSQVSVNHYMVVFRPTTLIPDIRLDIQ